MTRLSPPTLVLLAGSSEAGKSTAGDYLAVCGALRLKIRFLLVRLISGRPATHEGAQTRERFDPDEFFALLASTAHTAPSRVVVVESFIDAQLATMVKHRWPTDCPIVFITAPEALRIGRLAAATGVSYRHAAEVIRRKDARKQVNRQRWRWQEIADVWIDNNGTFDEYRQSLHRLAAYLGLNPQDHLETETTL